jgi:hypothetical protein
MSKRSSLTKREHWSQVINSQKNSGLSRRAFCKREGINYNQLLYWLKSIPDEAKVPMQSPAFIPVVLQRPNPVEICLPNGVEIRLASTDISSLVELLRSLGNEVFA